MAISRLASVASAVVSNPTMSVTLPVTLSAGANRMLLVSACVEMFVNAPPTAITATYGGLPLTIPTGPVATVDNEATFNAQQTGNNVRMVHMLALLESDLATLPLGPNDLVVTYDLSAQTLWDFAVGASLLAGVKQTLRLRGVMGPLNTQSRSTLAEMLPPGDAADALFAAGFQNSSLGATQITFDATSITEDFDLAFAARSGRFGGGALIPAGTPNPIRVAVSFGVLTSPTILVAVRLEQVEPYEPGVAQIETTMKDHPFGQAIPLRAYFANDAGVRTNPTVVVYRVGLMTVNPPPDPTPTLSQFGVDANVTNPATGEFLYSLPPPATAGNYVVSVTGSGAVQASATLQFRVLPNPFA